jgi:hypothetical protein
MPADVLYATGKGGSFNLRNSIPFYFDKLTITLLAVATVDACICTPQKKKKLHTNRSTADRTGEDLVYFQFSPIQGVSTRLMTNVI